MSHLSPVPIPSKRKFQLFCQSGLPLLAFVMMGLMVMYFWGQSVSGTGAMGELLPIRADVAPQLAGKLVPLNNNVQLEEFMDVQEGDVIAMLDPAPTEARIRVLRAEAEHLKAEVDSTIASTEFENARAAASLVADKVQIETGISRQAIDLAVDYVKTKAEYDTAAMEFKFNKARYDLLKPYTRLPIDPKTGDIILTSVVNGGGAAGDKASTGNTANDKPTPRAGIISDPEMITVNRDMRAAEATMIGKRAILTQIEAKQKELKKIMGEMPPAPVASAERLLAPVYKELAAKEAEVKEIEEQLSWLVVKAPFTGTISTVFVHPGQSVQPGTPICTIAAKEAKYVLSYVRQQSSLRPTVGMTASVRFRGRGEAVTGSIVKVGAQVEAISGKQLFDPKTQEWGLPIAIKLDWNPETKQAIGPRPGEIVFVQVNPTPVSGSSPRTAENIRLQKDGIVVASH